VEWSPDYIAIGLAFNSDTTRFAVLGNSGTVAVGKLPEASANLVRPARQSTFWDPDTSDFFELRFYKNTLISRASASNLFAMSAETGQILWFSRALGKIQANHFEIIVSEEDGIAFVHDGQTGRLLSLETGVWLSGEITADELAKLTSTGCATEEPDSSSISDSKNTISSVAFAGSGAITVQIGRCWFSRRPPLRDTALKERLIHLRSLTGSSVLPAQ
jgi:hypothetical protein